jgi:C1A family cysteine protease
MGHNNLSDWFSEELKHLTQSTQNRENSEDDGTTASVKSDLRGVSYPETHDWRNVLGINYVSPVKDLTAVGSCYTGYAFAAIASCESRFKIDWTAGLFTGPTPKNF